MKIRNEKTHEMLSDCQLDSAANLFFLHACVKFMWGLWLTSIPSADLVVNAWAKFSSNQAKISLTSLGILHE